MAYFKRAQVVAFSRAPGAWRRRYAEGRAKSAEVLAREKRCKQLKGGRCDPEDIPRIARGPSPARPTGCCSPTPTSSPPPAGWTYCPASAPDLTLLLDVDEPWVVDGDVKAQKCGQSPSPLLRRWNQALDTPSG